MRPSRRYLLRARKRGKCNTGNSSWLGELFWRRGALGTSSRKMSLDLKISRGLYGDSLECRDYVRRPRATLQRKGH